MLRKTSLVVLTTVLIATVALVWPSSALANKYWQGNERNTVYGVQAVIGTPSSAPFVNVPGFVASWVTNVEFNANINSAQCGWIKGDGQATINGVLLPSVPKSYKEVSTPGGQSIFTLYNTQSLGTVVTYDVENVPGTTGWKVYISGSLKGTYTYNNAALLVRACTEIDDGHIPIDNRTYASFANVKYKTSSSWTLFNQANFEPNLPPWLLTTIQSNSQYQTRCNW
jgi:hypothetical protein